MVTETKESYKTIQTQIQDGAIPYVFTIELMSYSSGNRSLKFKLLNIGKDLPGHFVWEGSYQDLIDKLTN